jgi:hypothetical protein
MAPLIGIQKNAQEVVKLLKIETRAVDSIELGIELGKVCFFTVVHFVTYNPTVTICSDPTVHSLLGITDT